MKLDRIRCYEMLLALYLVALAVRKLASALVIPEGHPEAVGLAPNTARLSLFNGLIFVEWHESSYWHEHIGLLFRLVHIYDATIITTTKTTTTATTTTTTTTGTSTVTTTASSTGK